MSPLRLLRRQNGFSLIQLLLEFTAVVIVAMGVTMILRNNSRSAVHNKDVAFASQKVVQMMEELRAVSGSAGEQSIGLLDTYTDVADSFVLTTLKGVTNPADPLSGNRDRRYVRRVHVEPLQNGSVIDPLARRVYIKISAASDKKVLAESMSVIYNSARQFSSTQVYDVYLLSIENIGGGSFDATATLDMMTGTFEELEARKPGLEFRKHVIKTLAYGRDPYYTPHINASIDAAAPNGLPWVYLYRGLVNGAKWNDPSWQRGRVRSEVVGPVNGSPGVALGPGQYALADVYNHAVRYPEEKARYDSSL
jgi:hypothetical protein